MYSEEDIVLCTVNKIEGVIVFVTLEDGSSGSIVTSEISPGRIRNIRDFVVPHKKIVCKILRIDPNNHVHLSLRRVNTRERKEVMDAYKKEKSFRSILKIVLKGKTDDTLKKIGEKYKLNDFIEKILENPNNAKTYLKKEEFEKIIELVNKKRPRDIFVKKSIILKCTEREDGVNAIKKTLKINSKNLDIRYFGGSRFSITLKGESYKTLNNQLILILDEIEKKAKKEKCQIEILKK